MVGRVAFVGVGRVEDEFGEGAVAGEVDVALQGLRGEGATSRLEASGGSPFTKTRLSCRMRTFSSGE